MTSLYCCPECSGHAPPFLPAPAVRASPVRGGLLRLFVVMGLMLGILLVLL